MRDVVADLERRFLPRLELLKGRLETSYPNYRLSVWSSSVGARTEYQGHDVGLECTFPDATADESDCVALSIGVKHLTGIPLLCDASVGWGQGASLDAQIDLILDPVPYSDASVADIESRLPELAAVFETAIASWQELHASA
jgi:hypothetical protein